ncbi:MAG: hypothetical protein QOC60_1151 [Frankiaceae bacterium]|jgi:hypothetical protein|nr:hypothetical protein [Frankiaceae bacterium]
MTDPSSDAGRGYVTGDDEGPPAYLWFGGFALLAGAVLLYTTSSRLMLVLTALTLIAGLALVTAGLVVTALWTDANDNAQHSRRLQRAGTNRR